MFTWLDFLLVIGVAALVGLGAQRRLSGALVGLGGALLFRPLLVVFNGNLYLALGLALVAGLLLGLISRAVVVRQRGADLLFGILGGLGGAALGVLLLLAFVTSLPLERNVNNQIIYPAQSLPAMVRIACNTSPLVKLGRDILLYPLLEAGGQLQANTGVYRALHKLMVVGEPWEGGS